MSLMITLKHIEIEIHLHLGLLLRSILLSLLEYHQY
jgi:hypothetical protein